MADEHGDPCIEVKSGVDIERELGMAGCHIFHWDLAWPLAERDNEVGTWGVETAHGRVLICGQVPCVAVGSAGLRAVTRP